MSHELEDKYQLIKTIDVFHDELGMIILKEKINSLYADYLMIKGERDMLSSQNIHLELHQKELKNEISNLKNRECCSIL